MNEVVKNLLSSTASGWGLATGAMEPGSDAGTESILDRVVFMNGLFANVNNVKSEHDRLLQLSNRYKMETKRSKKSIFEKNAATKVMSFCLLNVKKL